MFYRGAACAGAGAFGLLALGPLLQAGCDSVKEAKDEPLLSAKNLPPRSHMHSALKRATAAEPLDVLIIGGGASGTGTALDATTRSTKLIHGGVRYLEKAFFKLDYSQLKLVFEALKERRIMLDIAPHLSSKLPIMTPCYEWWEVPYYWAGLKAYDLVANFGNLAMSAYLTPSESLRRFPTLSETRADGATLKGTEAESWVQIEYYDGQFDDSRYALALAQTAALHGATVLNHATATALIKDKDGKVIGAKIKDNETGAVVNVHAKVVVNATGPFTDSVRQMADGKAEDIIMPSAGVHVTLPDYYSPDSVGMIVPKTKDGRVVFMLPWEGATIAGTTDSPSPVTHVPQAKEEDVQFILAAIEDYLDVEVRREDVQSVWCGIRPLAKDPSATDTADAVREHLVIAEKNGMVTVTGGKWTTYRLMAEDTVDAAIEAGNLATERGCVTERLPLVGAEKYSTSSFAHLAQAYKVPHRSGHININIARRLTAAYGDQAAHVTEIAQNERLSRRLVPWHDIIEAEVVYAARHEMCCSAVDFLARRSRLAFLDVAAARHALPRVIELLGKELKWSSFGWRYKQEMKAAEEFLKTFEPEKGS